MYNNDIKKKILFRAAILAAGHKSKLSQSEILNLNLNTCIKIAEQEEKRNLLTECNVTEL